MCDCPPLSTVSNPDRYKMRSYLILPPERQGHLSSAPISSRTQFNQVADGKRCNWMNHYLNYRLIWWIQIFLPACFCLWKNWFCLLVNEESCQVKNSYPRPSDLCIKLAMRLSIKKNNSIKQSLYFLWVYWQNDDMGSFLLKY